MKDEAASILVCFAVPPEASPFRRALREHAIDGVEVLVTGMGATRAREATALALDRLPRSLVLTTGFAGALDPALRNGQVVFEADTHTPSGATIAAALQRAGARPARFHCAERVAVTAADKARLRQSTQADVVEMESAAIRALCRQRGIPSATVRAISDEAAVDLPVDFNAVVDDAQQLSPWKMAGWILRHPASLGGLIHLQRHTQHAALALAQTLLEGLDSLTGDGAS